MRGPSKKFEPDDWCNFHCTVLKAPDKYGKPDNLSLKKAGDKIYACILSALRSYANRRINLYSPFDSQPIVEKSNCDEFFIDLTHLVYLNMCENVNLNFNRHRKAQRQFKVDLKHGMLDPTKCRFGYDHLLSEASQNRQLLALLKGAEIIAEVLDKVQEKLGYVISAGVAGNKFLAKLACHRSKPNGLAVLPTRGYFRVQREMPFTKLSGLGSTSGQNIAENFPYIQTIRDFLNAFYYKRLWEWMSNSCDPHAFYQKCRSGQDNELVIPKSLPPKITCGKSLNTCKEAKRIGLYEFMHIKKIIELLFFYICFTDANNQAFTKDDFLYHLHNRFHEMRDNLLYEFGKNHRIPNMLRLEIFQHNSARNAKRQLLFSYDMCFWPENFKNFVRWKAYKTDDLYEWKPILGYFKSEINAQAPFLFLNDGSFIYNLSRIHLIAYFDEELTWQ